jgi:hypothetical protein
MIKQVYQTSDGALFDTFELAQQHDINQEKIYEFKKYFDKLFDTLSEYSSHMDEHYITTLDDVAEQVFNNFDILQKIINDK